MNKDDMILVSVDDHLVEPPDMFRNHLQEVPGRGTAVGSQFRWQRQLAVPRRVDSERGAERGRRRPPKEEFGLEPQGLDEIRPGGCYQVDERIKDMNAGGIFGSICFPSFPPGFAGRLFATEDPEFFSLALVQAYNDWHVEEWCGAYPARFIPMCLPVIWDAEACAKEIRRNAARGVHALTFTEKNPAAMATRRSTTTTGDRCGRRWSTPTP